MATLVASTSSITLTGRIDFVQFGSSVVHVRRPWILAHIGVVCHRVCQWILAAAHIARSFLALALHRLCTKQIKQNVRVMQQSYFRNFQVNDGDSERQ